MSGETYRLSFLQRSGGRRPSGKSSEEDEKSVGKFSIVASVFRENEAVTTKSGQIRGPASSESSSLAKKDLSPASMASLSSLAATVTRNGMRRLDEK